MTGAPPLGLTQVLVAFGCDVAQNAKNGLHSTHGPRRHAAPAVIFSNGSRAAHTAQRPAQRLPAASARGRCGRCVCTRQIKQKKNRVKSYKRLSYSTTENTEYNNCTTSSRDMDMGNSTMRCWRGDPGSLGQGCWGALRITISTAAHALCSLLS